MAESLTLALKIKGIDEASSPLRRIGGAVQRLSRQTGLQRVSQRAAAVGTSFSQVGREIGAVRRQLTWLTAGAALFGGATLGASGRIEDIETRLGTVLGSTERAKALLKDLADFSAKTPFQLPGLANAATQLLGAGIAVEDVNDRLRMLGDLAAGAGKPVEQFTAVYAKAFNLKRVDTELMNQLAEAGVPIYEKLTEFAKRADVAAPNIRKALEQGRVEPQQLHEVIEMMTGEGGMYHRAMERQSQTLFGVLSTLKDNAFLLFAEVGAELERTFGVKAGMKDLIQWLRDAKAGFKAFTAEHGELVKADMQKSFRTLGGMVAATADAFDWLVESGRAFLAWIEELSPEGGGKLRKFVEDIGWSAAAVAALSAWLGRGLIVAIAKAALMIAAFGATLLTTPIGWVILGLAALAYAGWKLYDEWDVVVAKAKDLWGGYQDWWKRNVTDRGVPSVTTDDVEFAWKRFRAWMEHQWGGYQEWWAANVGFRLPTFSTTDAAESWRRFDAWVGREWAALDAWWSGLGLNLPRFTTTDAAESWVRFDAWVGREWAALDAWWSGRGLTLPRFTTTDAAESWRNFTAWFDTAWTEWKAELSLRSLWDAGVAWVDSLWDGFAARWRDFTAWLGRVTGPTLRFFGVGGDDAANDNTASANDNGRWPPRPAPRTLFGPPVPSILGSGAGAPAPARVDGKIVVDFQRVPPGVSVDVDRDRSSDIPIDVTAGYAMPGTSRR